MERHHFNQVLSTAAREMVEEQGTHDTLERAVQLATDIIASCDLAGISVVRPDGIDTPNATDEVIRKVDAIQHEIGEGPCVTALRQEDVVTAGDLSADQRWPHWGAFIADELGIHSCLNFRLFTTGANLGSLNLYARRRHAFTADDVLDGSALAAHVAVALAGSMREDHLALAMTTRTRIGQAQGILMERFGIDADRAFEVLRRVSNHENRKVHDVAFELVESRETPGST